VRHFTETIGSTLNLQHQNVFITLYPIEYNLIRMYFIEKTTEFDKWFRKLNDLRAKAKIYRPCVGTIIGLGTGLCATALILFRLLRRIDAFEKK